MASINEAKRQQTEIRRLWHEFKQINDRNLRRHDCVNDASLRKLNDRLDSATDQVAKTRRAA